MVEFLLRSIQQSVAKLRHGGKSTRVILAGKFALRRILLRFGDAPVRHKIGDHELRFPFSHNYPIDSILTSRESTNLSRVAAVANDEFEDFALIDIGANVGDTVAELRNVAIFPVLAVEGDETFYGYLESNVGDWEKVQTVRALVGEEEKEIRGKFVGNYGGSKQVARTNGSGSLTIQTLDRLLQSYPDFRSARMVKIDTDGYDCKIIRGGLGWIAEVRPIIFLEYDPHHLAEQEDDGLTIFPLLRDIGYGWLLLFEGNGDFMFSGTLDDERFLEEINAYFSGRASKKYADICLYPTEQKALFERCREEEIRVAMQRGKN